MKKGIWILGIIAAVWCVRCERDGFSEQEKALIMSQKGKIMRLYTINDRKDSLLLRQEAENLLPGDLRSAYYQILKEGLLKTVNDTVNAGVGIAAPQVGISKCLIVVQRFDKPGEPFEWYANPEIIYYSPELQKGPEGCLSIPGVRDSISRSEMIVVCYTDENTFQEKKDTVEGFTAVIFQHETDHLKGVLYIDKVGN